MKMKIWGARGSIPAPLAPQTVREKIIAAFLSMAEIEQEQLREKLLSAILAQSEFAGAGIDYEELGRGGRAIFEGGGELGQTLFAAATGFEPAHGLEGSHEPAETLAWRLGEAGHLR